MGRPQIYPEMQTAAEKVLFTLWWSTWDRNGWVMRNRSIVKTDRRQMSNDDNNIEITHTVETEKVSCSGLCNVHITKTVETNLLTITRQGWKSEKW